MLLDVGNSGHDDDVRAAVRAVNLALGRPALQVDWIVVTHFHGDHVGGLADLVDGAEPVTITGGVSTAAGSTSTGVLAADPFAVDAANEENGRSLIGIVGHGHFRYRPLAALTPALVAC